jgi:hypothetical protein
VRRSFFRTRLLRRVSRVPQAILRRAVFSEISPAAHGAAIGFLVALGVDGEYVLSAYFSIATG